MSQRNVSLKNSEDRASQKSFKIVGVLTGLDFKHPDGKAIYFLKALVVILY